MKRIKMIALMLCVALASALFLSACGRDETVTDGRGITVSGNKVYVGNYNEKTVVKVDYFNLGYGKDWIFDQAKEFVYENQQYAMVLTPDASLVTNFENKLTAGKNLSDLYVTPNAKWQSFAAQGWLEPLDDVYSAKPDGASGKTVGEKLDESYRDVGAFTKSGKTNYYVLPWTEMVTGIVYNADLFERYGLEIPETMAQFNTVCDEIISKSKAAGKSVAPFVFPGKIGGYFDFLGTAWWLQSSGVEGLEKFYSFDEVGVYDPSKSPAAGRQRALEEFKKYFGTGANEHAKYCLSGSMSKDAYMAQTDFINGNAAMMINGGWFGTEMAELLKSTGFNAKMMRVPFLEGALKENGEYVKVNYASEGFDFMSIPTQAKQKAGAKAFLSFMVREDNLKRFTTSSGSLRPFEYTPDKTGLSGFALSALNILEESSATYFDFATGLRRYKAQKFLTANPYMAIISGSTVAEWGNAEFSEAKNRWDNEWKV